MNRTNGKTGYCRCNDKIKIALVSTHNYEEPSISGKNGSGTIFFSNCNLNCIYCQNYEISQLGKGKDVTVEELAKIILRQQAKGVNNINLVTPTMYAYQIIEALKIAKANGLHIPVIYNTNGYENVETIKMLAGYIDVYLPDLKYYSNELSTKYSKADNYFENSKHILKWIKENMPEGTYVSVMAQYFPTYKAKEDRLLNRKLSKKEYKEIENYLYTLELENGYIQELGEHEEEYVPDFNMHM